jgi:predicted DNA-binding WGR domain protein
MEAERHPWKVRLEYRGTSKRTGAYSEKWWSVSGDGSGSVEVNHGKIGSRGRSNPFVFDLGKGLTTMEKKINDGYECAAGAAENPPVVTPTTTHAELPGIYRDVRRIVPAAADGSYIAMAGDGSEICRLTTAGARKMLSLSPLIEARSEQAVTALSVINF